MITLALSVQYNCVYQSQGLHANIEWITMRIDCTRPRLQAFSRIFPSRKGVLTYIEKDWSFIERGLNERKVRRNHNSIYRRVHKFLTVSERRMHCLAFYGRELALSFGVSFESNVLSSRALLTLFTYWRKQYMHVTSTFLSIYPFLLPNYLQVDDEHNHERSLYDCISTTGHLPFLSKTWFLHSIICLILSLLTRLLRTVRDQRRVRGVADRQFLNSNISARIPDNRNI